MNLLVVIFIQASFYALLGMGYVLIYRATRVLNLAHGDLMVFGAYLFFQALAASGGSLTLAIIAAVVGAALLGALVYLGVMRPLASFPVAVGVLATIALGLVLRTIVTLIWTAQTRYPAELLGRTGQPIALFAGVSISGIDVLIIAAAIIAMLGFPLLLRLSTVGIEMRGVAENALLAAQRGINLHGVYALAWSLSTLTGALAGILMALDSGVTSGMPVIGLKAFPAALVGGLDSLVGALAGSLIVAAAEVLLIYYVDPLLADVVPFLVLIAMLIVRPWGLFGTREELDRV